MSSMKSLKIGSQIMNGIEKTTVTNITPEGVTLTGKRGKQFLTFPVKGVEHYLQKGIWTIINEQEDTQCDS